MMPGARGVPPPPPPSLEHPLEFTLPWPPTMNNYWRSPNCGPLAGRHLLSVAGRCYRQAAVLELITQKVRRSAVGGPLDIWICAYEPWTPRRRDLDNLLKPVLDAMTHGRIVEDDRHFDRVTIERGESTPEGRLQVIIRPRTDPRRSP